MLTDLIYRLRALFRRSSMEAEMNDELRFHFEQEVNKYEKSGLPHEEAVCRARLAFGGVVQAKEECREARGIWFVETAVQDLRHSLRRLRRSPGFAMLALTTLGLGIGATTAIFSVVNGVLVKPLPYPHPGRLVAVRLNLPGIDLTNWPLSASDYFIFRERSRTFQDIGLYNLGGAVNVTGVGKPERVPALEVTDGLLRILGVKPTLGRLFTRADDVPGAAETTILTYGYWHRKFGGNRSAIGRTIDVDGKPRMIIGVLPQSFQFLGMTDLAMLLPAQLNRERTYLGNFAYGGLARLKPGVTLAEANVDVAHMIPIVLRSFPPSPGFSRKAFEDLRIAPDLSPLKQQVVGDVGKVLWVLLGGVGLVLLIACANIANLLLLRADGRQQELAIRAALGASRGRIAAELFCDSLILAVLGGLLGVGLAYGALRALVAIAPASLPRLNEIGVDGSVVLFTLAVSVAASLLSGSAPVLKYASVRIGTGLREAGRSLSESRKRHRQRGVLVIVQVALAVVLLVSSGLMIRTFRALTRVNPGFSAPSEIQTFRIAFPDTQIKNPEHVFRIQERILYKLKALPSILSASICRDLPMAGSGPPNPVYAKDHVYSSGKLPIFRWEFVAPGFFRTIGTPLVAGHDFTWSEIDKKVPVAIVSEKLAHKYWREPANALGKEIRLSTKGIWREVVGVVGDVHQDGVDKEAPPSVYWPILMAHFGSDPNVEVRRNVAFVIRTPRAGSQSFINEIRRAARSVDPNLPLFAVHTLDYYYSKSMARTSFALVMLALAGGMGLLLGIVGLYGVIAYSVSQRKREIGIRMALGARVEDVQKMVVRQGFILAAFGVVVGVLAALAATRLLGGLLYGVKPTDPATFIGVSVLLLAVALLASYLPAREAARVDPAVTLRHE